jgi:hypothetical protein
MGGAVDWIDSLPLLPAGTPLFVGLPARAIVVTALAPAIGEGVIALADGERTGVLVIRGGGISDAVSFDGARCSGEAALQSVTGWDAAVVSASRLSDEAMSILGPLINGQRCYDDLRLQWTRWSELVEDLRARGGTYVVDVRTALGRGVTVIRCGQQVATYTDAHPSLGDPKLIDALTSVGIGSVRVTIGTETSERWPAVLATRSPHIVGAPPRGEVNDQGEAPRIAASVHAASTPSAQTPITLGEPTSSAARIVSGSPAASSDRFEGNATLMALFGEPLSAQPLAPLVLLEPHEAAATTSVASVLPELKLLVQRRLQRSAGPVEEVIDAAADGGDSVTWLADRVRVMTVRGFMASTLERLANDMLNLARS